MADQHEDVFPAVPEVRAAIEISKNWTAGGVNDYGGFVLECASCQHVFHFRLGRDISDSRVVRGAKALETYDDEIPGDKDDVLRRFHLETK